MDTNSFLPKTNKQTKNWINLYIFKNLLKSITGPGQGVSGEYKHKETAQGDSFVVMEHSSVS